MDPLFPLFNVLESIKCPLPDDEMVSKDLIDAFMAILGTHFPNAKKRLVDCAIVAAFLQSTKVFDRLFCQFGDRLLVEGYLDTLIECLDTGTPVKNILTRTFCRLMSVHGFNKDYHTITFTGDAGVSFAAVVKNKILFKDLIGWQHGQYTHTLQWFGVCLLAEHPECIGGYKFTCSVGEIYAYMVTHRSTFAFPGELIEKSGNFAPKEFSTKSIWDVCVDCFRDIKHLENPAINLYTSSYRSPANITDALLEGPLCITWMGAFMRRRGDKYFQINKKYKVPGKFQQLCKAMQTKKLRLVYHTGSQQWVPKVGQGTLFIWVDKNDTQVQKLLGGDIQKFEQNRIAREKEERIRQEEEKEKKRKEEEEAEQLLQKTNNNDLNS